jgi:hypothetical protein
VPFAKKFRAMMELPFAGDALGDFVVESVEAHDVAGDFGQHGYSVRMVLRGPGGQQGVRRTVGALLSARPLTFSSYGNPYQLWCGRPEIESLGNKRYAVTARGAGVPIALEAALLRFLHELDAGGLLAEQPGETDLQEVVATYLDRYREEIQRSVSRYRGKLARTEGVEA